MKGQAQFQGQCPRNDSNQVVYDIRSVLNAGVPKPKLENITNVKVLEKGPESAFKPGMPKIRATLDYLSGQAPQTQGLKLTTHAGPKKDIPEELEANVEAFKFVNAM